MICSECGNYQPDRAKFCGICGAGLSQEGLAESFLKDGGDKEIVLPRHRSFFFYLAIIAVLLLALLIFTAAGYLVYRAGWGDSGNKPASQGEVTDNTLDYVDNDIGFAFSYLDNWKLEQGYPIKDQLISLKISLSSQKNIELTGYQLDPVVSIGGFEGIKEFLAQDAANRIKALGGETSAGTNAGSNSSSGAGEDTSDASNDTFVTAQVNGLSVFHLDFTANVMGEQTSFMLYYVVADDYYFLFQGRSPQSEYNGVRSQIMATAGSFKWIRQEATGNESSQPAGT